MKPDDETTTPKPGSMHSDLRDLAPAPSARRARELLSAEDANRLVDFAIRWRADLGERHLAREVVGALATLLPGCSLGVRMASAEHGEIVELVGEPVAPRSDPTRLFPHLPEERVYPVSDGAAGATVHLAGNELPAVGTPAEATLQRAIDLFASVLRHCRGFEEARRAGAELRRLQAQVIQAEKLASLGQIAAGLVHELNTPLTSIIAYTDYLRRRPSRDEADEEERLQRIGEAAERVLSFSRDLMSYARPAAEIPAPVPLADVLQKALAFCDHQFGEAGVTVTLDLPEPTPLVRGIAGQLTQVFVNLFTNAAHAMPSGGELHVASAYSDDGEHLRVVVSDTGIGISGEHLDRVFEPFFTTKTLGEGTGLGLSIVHGIVTGHGGSLEVQSEAGRGATFTLLLPLAVRPSTEPPPGHE